MASGLNGWLPDCLAASTGLLLVSFVTGASGLLPQAANVQQNAPSNRQLMIRRNIIPFLTNGMPNKNQNDAFVAQRSLRNDRSRRFSLFQ